MRDREIRRQARRLRDSLREGVRARDIEDVRRETERKAVRRNPRVLGMVR